MAACVFGVERGSGQDNNCNSHSQENVPPTRGGPGKGGARKAQTGFEFSLLPKNKTLQKWAVF